MVRRRADRSSRRRSSRCARTTACSSATATSIALGRHRAAAAAAPPGSPVNGAYLSFDIGPIAFQPAELAKIAIVIFLASYLRDTRQVLVLGARRFAGITFPPLKHLGPLLAVWGTAMVLLFFIHDLGSSLMFFGGFLALIYVATNRLSFVVIGLACSRVGAWFLYAIRPTIENRVDAWLHPFDDELYDQAVGGSYQIAQSLFAQADGGFFGQRLRPGDHRARRRRRRPAGGAHRPHLRGDRQRARPGRRRARVLLVYLLIVERGFSTAMLATRLVLQAAGRPASPRCSRCRSS